MRVVILALVLSLPLPVSANSFCDMLVALSGEGNEPPDGATCRTTLLLGGQQQKNCYWSYPYRSDEARSRFDAFGSGLAECLGPEATKSVDQSVNHPDAYELHLFELGGEEYAVSLKDKGALQRTLVFLRVPITN